MLLQATIGRMIPGATPDGILAGYRLVRRLGRGSRAEVFLGSSVAGNDAAPRTAALKVFGRDVGMAQIEAELEALSRASLPHCAALLDVASVAGSAPVAVLGRVSRGSVAQLLRERTSLEPGEAVTLLAPIALMLNSLHQAGVAHTSIEASKVHLTEAGEPVLLGFGGARLFSPGAPRAVLDEEPAALADRRQLAALAGVVLDRVRRGSGARANDLAGWVQAAGDRDFSFAPELAERLFALAPAVPIEFAVRAGEPAHSVPARIGAVAALPQVAEPPAAPSPEPGATRPGWLASLHLPEWLEEWLADDPLRLAREKVSGVIGSVRPRVWLLAAGVGLALVAAILLTPDAAPDSSASEPVASAPPGDEVGAGMPALPDDPVLALPPLLEARERCIRDLSVLCLDGVDQAGSAAMADDAELIRRILAGEELPAGVVRLAGSPELVERLGDSALVRFGPETDPASVLMIRSEAGWRIRTFLAP